MGIRFLLGSSGVVFELDVIGGEILQLRVPFIFDSYRVVFSFVVVLISMCVIYYNGFYIDGEQFYNRFCKLVLLFVLSILFLVMIPNFLGLIIGWDGLGLTSFLLVVYYQDKRSLGSGILTVLRNRVGDVLFFVAIRLIRAISRWGYVDLRMEIVSSFLCGVVIIGCITKRAQIPFSAWLPAAIAAPSPVSALVHSSTLVTAGVYVLVRFSDCIAGGWFIFLRFVARITMIMSAISAVFEPDVKKVVALSTLRQLGVIILAISVGAASVCFFHLVSHALFKALIFLCVGGVIHFSGVQDLRYIGGYFYRSPVCMGWLIVSCLSLIGFPFLAGFYSKDLVLEAFLRGGMRMVLCVMVIFSTCLTALYRGLMVFSVYFFSMEFSNIGSCVSRSFVILPCSVLGFGALFGGILMQSFVLEFNLFFSLSGIVKIMPFLCFVSGLFLLFSFIL